MNFFIKNFVVVSLFIITSLIISCATPARITNMQIASGGQYCIKTTPLTENILLRNVTGGEETNPLWASKVSNSDFEIALKNSLITSCFYGTEKTAKFIIDVNLEKYNNLFLVFL